MESVVREGDIWKAGLDQSRVGFRMGQFVRDVREPRPARLELLYQGQRLLDGLMHRMRHVPKRIEHEVIQSGKQQLGRIGQKTEIREIRRRAETKTKHCHLSMPRRNG